LAIFDIDVQGGSKIKLKHPDTLLVFIQPPSIEVLERRLRDRKTTPKTPSSAVCFEARAETEKGLESYDYVIVNDDLDSAYAKLSPSSSPRPAVSER